MMMMMRELRLAKATGLDMYLLTERLTVQLIMPTNPLFSKLQSGPLVEVERGRSMGCTKSDAKIGLF